MKPLHFAPLSSGISKNPGFVWESSRNDLGGHVGVLVEILLTRRKFAIASNLRHRQFASAHTLLTLRQITHESCWLSERSLRLSGNRVANRCPSNHNTAQEAALRYKSTSMSRAGMESLLCTDSFLFSVDIMYHSHFCWTLLANNLILPLTNAARFTTHADIAMYWGMSHFMVQSILEER